MCDGTKRILVVDDEERVLFVWREALRELGSGYDVITASTSAEARERIREAPFSLIITDLKLPTESGVELTELVRVLDPEVPVVWMTAYGCYRVAEEARQLGVVRCLDKPVNLEQIRQVVRGALERSAEPPR
jgi:two-component system response regulator PilR (NtrC family)